MKKPRRISPEYAAKLEKWAHEPPCVKGRANWKRCFDRKTLGKNKCNPFPFASVPAHLRHHAVQWYNNKIAELNAKGITITQGKNASLMANAAWIAKHNIHGASIRWTARDMRKKNDLRRLREQRKMDEFKSQPAEQRMKVLPT